MGSASQIFIWQNECPVWRGFNLGLTYIIKGSVDVESIGELRQSVGWNAMTEYYNKSLSNSYSYICCFDYGKLVGFLNIVSNASSDAYIQDLMVRPEYQGKGIGTELMKMAIDKLKADKIYAISVLFDDKLVEFYKKFGFFIMYAGQIINE